MKDYLHNLVARSLNRAECARPRTPAIFEPLQPALNGSVRELFEGVREETAEVEDAQSIAERKPEQRQAKESKRMERRTLERSAEDASPQPGETHEQWPVVHPEQTRVTEAPAPFAQPSNRAPDPPAPTLNVQPADASRKGRRGAMREESKQQVASTPAPEESLLREPPTEIPDLAVQTAPPAQTARTHESEPEPRRVPAPTQPSPVAQRNLEPRVVEHVSPLEVESEARRQRPPEVESEARVQTQPVSRIEPLAEQPDHASRTRVAVEPQVTRHFAPRLNEPAAGEPEQAKAQGAESEHTIQVTIGRIEVRAVAAADTQPKGSAQQRRQNQSLMSLDDYLRQRARGGHR